MLLTLAKLIVYAGKASIWVRSCAYDPTQLIIVADEVPYFHKSVLPRLFNLTEISLVTPDSDLLNAMTEIFGKRRRLDSLFPNLFRPLRSLSLGSLYISSVDHVQHDAIPKLLAETPGLKRCVWFKRNKQSC